MEMNINDWQKWADNSLPLYSGIDNGGKIAFSIDGVEDKLVVFTKNEDSISANLLTNLDDTEIDDKIADLVFEIKPMDVEDIISEDTFSMFLQLNVLNKIKIYPLVDVKTLSKKGYEAFLSKIGANIANSSNCGCCCC
nr:hypothetical protein [Methanobrevibacter smithii]